MPERRVNIFLPGFPHCPTCWAESHVLTFLPEVEADGTRVLAEFAWRCPNDFATALPDIPLPSWRNQSPR